MKTITLQQMEALVRLIEERNFSRAAKRMFLTQPALTKHIKNAEEALGATVVNRGGLGVSLTPEGKVLYDYSKRILRLREEAGEKVLRARGGEAGDISVGASTIPATYLLPRILSGFKKQYTNISVHVHASDSEEVLEMILNGDADIGLIGKEPLSPKVHAEALWEDRLVLVVPAGHRWGRKASVTAEELSKEPFVIREKGSGTREMIESCLRDAGLNPARWNVAAELGSSEAVKEAVVAGLGVSILSVHAVQRELKQGILRAVPIRNCRIERSFYLIYRRRFDLMHHHRLFLDFVRRYRTDIDQPQGRKK